MKQSRIRILLALLALASVFAGWRLLRPYEWSPDAKARFRIDHVMLKRDHTFYWLDVKLDQNGQAPLDLEQPILLHTANGRQLKPTDPTFSGPDLQHIDTVGLKFWIEESDLAGPMQLEMHGARLALRTGQGAPKLSDGDTKEYSHNSW